MHLRIQGIIWIGLFIVLLLGGLTGKSNGNWKEQEIIDSMSRQIEDTGSIRIFMTGDVMLGRGIDQILAHPSNPVLYERYMKSAKGYVQLAEQKNGRIPYPVDSEYIWGITLDELKHRKPDLRLINLETAITISDDHWKGKGINYRMNPQNIACLKSAYIDYCSLANNHVLDWGVEGLKETISTLNKAGIKYSGAGLTAYEASRPAVFNLPGKGRVLVFAFGFTNSGIPRNWIAGKNPGVNYLPDYSLQTVKLVQRIVNEYKQEGDVILASVHWGGNWGYELDPDQVEFAHALIDKAGIDVIHGHSSHHVKGIEVYNNRLILYGCGDFLNDYEGISGHEAFRDELGLMYFVHMEQLSGKLLGVALMPTRIKNFRIQKTTRSEFDWILNTLNREGHKYGTQVSDEKGNYLILKWGE